MDTNKNWCFDCNTRLVEGLGAYPTKGVDKKYRLPALIPFDSQELCGHWNPDYWVEVHGYQKNWGDAAVRLPDFQILRRELGGNEDVEFLILCPDKLRRPVRLHDGWGDY